MSGPNGTKLPKLPFYGADLVLSALAGYGIYQLGAIQGPWEALIAAACVAGGSWGAWLAVVPWLREHETRARLSESSSLTSAIEQIQNLEKVAQTIQNANANWQNVQDSASKTVQAAQEISLRMKRETDEFMKFLDQADEQEKSALRLEVQKARKLEDDWLQVTVRMLDHVYALYSAAARSGQPQLTHQLEQFQQACRDAARRVGLSPFAPNKNESFDPRAHQSVDQKTAVPDGAVIGETLATGYTYQGQLLRRALVRVAPREPEPSAAPTFPARAREEPGPAAPTEIDRDLGETDPQESRPALSPGGEADYQEEAPSMAEEFLETDPLPEPSPPQFRPAQAPKPASPAHPQLPLE